MPTPCHPRIWCLQVWLGLFVGVLTLWIYMRYSVIERLRADWCVVRGAIPGKKLEWQTLGLGRLAPSLAQPVTPLPGCSR